MSCLIRRYPQMPYITILPASLFRSLSDGSLPEKRRDLFSRLPHPAVYTGCCEDTFESHVEQISPDKDVNFRYTTAAFTISPEPWASLCCANSPGDLALYAVSVPLIKSGAGLVHSFALRLPSDPPSRKRPPLQARNLRLAFG